MAHRQGLFAVRRLERMDVPRVLFGSRRDLACGSMSLGDVLLAYQGFDGTAVWWQQEIIRHDEIERRQTMGTLS